MSNESVNQDVKQESVSDNDKNQTVNQDDKQNMIPQARFNEYVAKSNSKIEELTNQITSFKTKEANQRKERLEKEGNYKQLLDEANNELTDLRKFKQEIGQQMAEKKERLIEQLPENQRSIYNGLSVDALEQHINIMTNTNVAKTPTSNVQPNRPPKTENGGYTSLQEWAAREPAEVEKYLNSLK